MGENLKQINNKNCTNCYLQAKYKFMLMTKQQLPTIRIQSKREQLLPGHAIVSFTLQK